MITNSRFWLLILLLSLAYFLGLFVDLIENDSAQFAVMAKRMVVENDFLSLIKGTDDYLDKPHLHYWLAAFSFLLFGFEEWAYRLPALIVTALGAYSSFGLGKVLYNKEVGRLAALIFLSSQTIILSNIDVRTDAVLTGFTIFALWQLTKYLKSGGVTNLILGAIGAGLAFSTKGQIAILVISLPLLAYIAYEGSWKKLWNWKTLLGILFFFITISPVLFAYYQQFDLHPEKVIRGQSGRSGIYFILWEQSFERLSGEGMGKNSSDYFFFFHSFLWVFLPWTILGIAAYINRWKIILKMKSIGKRKGEALTLGGITAIFLVISFAQFKLPHYLNIIIPLFAVLSAAYMISTAPTTHKILLRVQLGIATLVGLTVNLIVWAVFPQGPLWIKIVVILATLLMYSILLLKESAFSKMITVTVFSAVLLNCVLNGYFYPTLLQYQGGSELAELVKTHHLPEDKIYKLGSRHSWAMDFHNNTAVKESSIQELKAMKRPWLYATDADLKSLLAAGMDWDMEFSADHFRITRLQFKFLSPRTRDALLEKQYLVRLR